MEEVDVTLLKGRRAVQPSRPLGPIEDSWLAPRGRGRDRGKEAVTVAVAVAETERKRETSRRMNDERAGGGGGGGQRGGRKGSSGRVATRGGVERRYENGVKEKKEARLPSKL